MSETRLQIADGIVVNAIEVNPDNVPGWAEGWPVAPEGVGIGWVVDGAGYAPPPSPPPVVPVRIDAVQFMRALRLVDWGAGTAWDAVKAAIEAAPLAVQEDWEKITVVPRYDATVLVMASALAASAGLSEAEMTDLMDRVFILGATL